MELELRHCPDGHPNSRAFKWPFTEIVRPIKPGYNLVVKTHCMPDLTDEGIDNQISLLERGYIHGGMTEAHIPMVIAAYKKFKTERLLGVNHDS